MNTSEVIIQYLARAGIGHLFGYPGDPTVEFLEAARRAEMQFVLGTREGTAGLMAEAYGQLTGRPGVCVSTLGPGSTNLVNAVASAWLDRVPMIAISGQIETKREPTFTHQVIDHQTLFKPIAKWAAAVQPHTVGAIMRRALRTAMAERPGAGAPHHRRRRGGRHGQRRRHRAAAAGGAARAAGVCGHRRAGRPGAPPAGRTPADDPGGPLRGVERRRRLRCNDWPRR